MTVQLKSEAFGKSKQHLAEALNSTPDQVCFYEPTIVRDVHFTGDKIKPGHSFPVVMDPKTRLRFAMVGRLGNGTFWVK